MIFAPAITGPTASGKTALSLKLAEDFGFEIISADSMQIYRGMDIGTAKATAEERARVPHHLIDVVSPSEQFSTCDYREIAASAARDIVSRGKFPLFVGGTGLYLDSIIRADTLKDAPESSREFREVIGIPESDCEKTALWERLAKVDAESAAKIHPNNTRRVIRALEIYETTGIPKSELDRRSREKSSEFDILMITLDFHNRENLYRRIDARVDEMITDGLYGEVEALVKSGALTPDSTAGQAIGYKEMLRAVNGEITLLEAAEAIKLATRRYAKRQLTWFRHTDAVRIMADRESGEMRGACELYAEIRPMIEEKLKLYI